jgi:hypothetical protein
VPKIDDPQKLPRFVGIVADYHYARKDWIYNLIMKLKPHTVVVLPEGAGLKESIRDVVLLRGDLHLKEFQVSAQEKDFLTFSAQKALNDYLFLSYLKFNKGFLMVFPRKFQSKKDARPDSYGHRIQDIIINAYIMDIRSDRIEVERESSEDVHTADI